MKKIRAIQAAIIEEKKLRVCAYVRVSTDQTEQKNNFPTQMEHYTAYIKNNSTWNFAGIYDDEPGEVPETIRFHQFYRMWSLR